MIPLIRRLHRAGHRSCSLPKTGFYWLVLFFLPAMLSLSCIAAYGSDTGTKLCPYEMKLFQCINQYRASNGLAALTVDNTLQGSAKSHSRHMGGENCLSHDGFHDRFASCGRSHCVENVGWNSPTPEEQLSAWKNSEGHNSNLLNKKIRFTGISKVGAFVTFFACD